MTTNPPESETPAGGDEPAAEAGATPAGPSPAEEFAARVAEMVGSSSWSGAHGTPKVKVDPAGWTEAVRKVRDGAALDFFSFLSAIDWASEVAVGEPLAGPANERYEVICLLASTRSADRVVLSTDLPKDAAVLDSLVDVYPGADWHEREAAEMFGIDFSGHPNLVKLYLPDGFEGYPLRKSFPLLSREVKPWPGTVDVEAMPSTENEEAGGDGEEGQS